MNYSISDIIDFLRHRSGNEKVLPNTDIFLEIGLVGDDFHEMMEAYSEKFSVDLKNYLWYFHTDEEGQNLGALFFDPPYKLVERIPLTPNILLEFANKGNWELKYPEHRLPKVRMDIVLNRFIFGFFILICILVLLKK